MASLRKRTKSPYFVACYYDSFGKRTQRSTETKDKRVAQRLALEWEAAAQHARAGTLTTDKARRVLNEMLTLTGQSIDNQSVREFTAGWLRTKESTRAANTVITYQPVLEGFLSTLGRKADAPLSAVMPSDMEAHRDALTSSGKRATTVRQYLKIIGAMFEAARKQGIVQTNPAKQIEIDDAAQGEREPFTPDEVTTLLMHATGDWRTAIMLGAFAGMRLGDATKLSWNSIDLAKEVICYMPEKTRRKGREQTTPIHPVLLAHLMTVAGDDARAFVCPSLANRSTGGKTGLSNQFTNLMRTVGIDNKPRLTARKDGGVSRSQSAKSFHSLRHFFNTSLMDGGVDEKLRMELSGHTTASVNRRYTHAKMENLRAAVNKVKG